MDRSSPNMMRNHGFKIFFIFIFLVIIVGIAVLVISSNNKPTKTSPALKKSSGIERLNFINEKPTASEKPSGVEERLYLINEKPTEISTTLEKLFSIEERFLVYNEEKSSRKASGIHKAVAKDISLQQFITAGNLFATKLYQKTIEEMSGNVIISPTSVQKILSRAMLEANGETKQEMKIGLGYQNFTDELIVSPKYKMFGCSIHSKFNRITKKGTNLSSKMLNFKKDDYGVDQKSATTINIWAKNQPFKTNENSVKIIDHLLTHLHEIYFESFWIHKFYPSRTGKSPFYLNANESIEIDFMRKSFAGNMTIKFGKFDNLDASAIELPCKESNIIMMIVLPNKKTGLAELESKLHTIDFGNLSSQMDLREIVVELPKFKIEFEMKLNEPLKKMGMNKMFTDQAEFKDQAMSDNNLSVSDVVHKSIIEVNEDGTEPPTNASYSPANAKSAFDYFTADHPFLFAIICSESKVVHFIGRFRHPLQ